MNIQEKHIKAAAKLYQMRDTAKRFYKDEWPAKQAEWKPIIQACMAKHNCNELEAGIKLSSDLREHGFSIIVVMATVCEMIEPS
jgi:hypothetical protein